MASKCRTLEAAQDAIGPRSDSENAGCFEIPVADVVLDNQNLRYWQIRGSAQGELTGTSERWSCGDNRGDHHAQLPPAALGSWQVRTAAGVRQRIGNAVAAVAGRNLRVGAVR